MQAIIIGLLVVAAFTALALGLYFGQSKRSARGDKSKIVRTVQGSPLDTMSDNPTAAVRTCRREGVHRALEAVEYMTRPLHRDLEGLVVIVPARFADRHSARSLQRSRTCGSLRTRLFCR
jgi:hypothetical protein